MSSYCHNCCLGCGSVRNTCYQFSSLEYLHDNSFTHSVSSIEIVVASNKVVSTSKNAHSAHGKILKVESLRMREGWKRKRWEGDPQSHGEAVKACSVGGNYMAEF